MNPHVVVPHNRESWFQLSFLFRSLCFDLYCFLCFLSVVTGRDRRDHNLGVRNGTVDVAVSESDVKGHRLHPTASHLNLLVSLVRSFLYIDFSPFFILFFFNLIVCVCLTHSTLDYIYVSRCENCWPFFSSLSSKLWSSVPEAVDTQTWCSVFNGVGQRLKKEPNSCKDFLIASADA